MAQKLCTKNKFEKKNLNFDRENVIPIFRSKFFIFVVGQFQIFFSTFSFHFFFPSKTFNFDHFHFRIIKNVSNLDFSIFFFWKKVLFSGGYFLHFFRFLTRFFFVFFGIFWKILVTGFRSFSLQKTSNFVKNVVFGQMNDCARIVYKKIIFFFFHIYSFFQILGCFNSVLKVFCWKSDLKLNFLKIFQKINFFTWIFFSSDFSPEFFWKSGNFFFFWRKIYFSLDFPPEFFLKIRCKSWFFGNFKKIKFYTWFFKPNQVWKLIFWKSEKINFYSWWKKSSSGLWTIFTFLGNRNFFFLQGYFSN